MALDFPFVNNKCYSNYEACPLKLTNKKGCFLLMQNDGNLVVYDDNHSPLWASNTQGKGIPKYRYVMQQDGNLVVYDQLNNALWASNTQGKGAGPYTLTLTNQCTLVITDAFNDITYSNCGCSKP